MATNCGTLGPLDTIRVTRLEGCGVPAEGEDNAFVADCIVSVNIVENIEQRPDIEAVAANGDSCGFRRGRRVKRGSDVTITVWSPSPELLELVSGAPVRFDADGEPIGFSSCRASFGEFAFEAWQEPLDAECDPDGDLIYQYWLLPWLDNAVVTMPQALADGAFQFAIEANTRIGGGWQLGPWDVQDDGLGEAGPLLEVVGEDCDWISEKTPIPPPEATCDYVTVPANNEPGE